jgi:hypothetical protein
VKVQLQDRQQPSEREDGCHREETLRDVCVVQVVSELYLQVRIVGGLHVSEREDPEQSRHYEEGLDQLVVPAEFIIVAYSYGCFFDQCNCLLYYSTTKIIIEHPLRKSNLKENILNPRHMQG